MGWTTPRTWTTSELVTKAIMDTHVRDNFLYLYGLAGAEYSLSGWNGSASGASFGPADSTTYYFGSLISAVAPNPTTTAAEHKIYIPKAGRLTCARVVIQVRGTLGSSETSTISIRLNNTTDTTLSSSVVASGAEQTYSSSALNITVAAGDYVEFKWATPAWATNPTDVNVNWQLFVEP